jgi:CRISPR-associated endonuclease Cas1
MDATNNTVRADAVQAYVNQSPGRPRPARLLRCLPAPSDEAVAARLSAITSTFARDPIDPSVAVVDGFGCRIRVERRYLEVEDGIGPNRRTRRYSRAERTLRRLVVVGDGFLTTTALRWCRDVGVSVVVLDDDGVVVTGGPPAPNDPRLRRAQVLAGGDEVGVEIVRQLVSAKLAGQERNLATYFERPDLTAAIGELRDALDDSANVDQLRQLEAAAANVYWSAWVAHSASSPRFSPADLRRVPTHWASYPGRASGIAANGNRKAHVPVNGLLNYLYRLAEVEATFAASAVGLDPSIGLLHLDSPRRASLALDLMEPVRPVVEAHVLELCARRTFRCADFVEGREGCVRVMAPLTHELAETMPTWARAVAPYAEMVRNLLGDSITGKFSPSTPLTGAKARAAQARVRARKAAGLGSTTIRSRRERDALAGAWTCPECGGAVTNHRHVRCDACIAADPASTPEIRGRRGVAIAARKRALSEWDKANPDTVYDPELFRREILPRLSAVPLAEIMEAAGCSKASASDYRRGKRTPHVSTWAALAKLVES